ncbi:transposase (fragment) (plasmid) [Cupriavidus taiwanensis]|uniref:Transposase n=1 Tax=Cupriavidus taiwanensis TaxID=164546 RepID=A0A375FID5_9BURK
MPRSAERYLVLQTGIPLEDLPQELGFGSGMTCWRRLRHWQASGICERAHLALLTRLREHDQIDWSGASIDCAAVVSPRRGEQTGPNPTDRAKQTRQQTPSHRRSAGRSSGTDCHLCHGTTRLSSKTWSMQ